MYNDPTGHCPVCVVAIVVGLKVIDYGWTAYDVVQAGSVYLDKNATQEMQDEATATIAMAIAFEAIEPDDASPVALPIDDIVRHGDDIADIYKHAVQNPDSNVAVLGSFIDNYKGFAENVPDGATHLFTNKYDEFTAKYGKEGWWKHINEPFVQKEIIDKGKSVFTTTTKEVIDILDTETSFLKREINKLLAECPKGWAKILR